MTWQEKVQYIADRVREPDLMATDQIVGQVNLPYFKKNFIEDHLRIVGLELLRETPEDELMAIGSDAIETITGDVTGIVNGINYIELPLTIIRVLSARIDESPAVYAGAANFLQRSGGGSRTGNCFTFYETFCAYIGNDLTMVCVKEPSLADFKADKKILPEGRDLEWIDRAIKRMMIEDFEPDGRA